MISGLLASSVAHRVTWLETDALSSFYGPKGARLLALPRPWVPPFLLFSADLTHRLVGRQLSSEESHEVEEALSTVRGADGLIVRSSVLKETIWERGTFESVILRGTVSSFKDFLLAVAQVQKSAGNRTLALVVQEYIGPHEWGEFGNLARVSKTRDQWEYSLRSDDPVLNQDRFNSQRDTAHATNDPLLSKARLSRERLFGSVAAWINNELTRSTNDRVNCEWIRQGDRYFLVQIDREDEDVFGVNPMQLHVEPTIKIGGSGTYLSAATTAERAKWDKLAVLDELYFPDDEIVPTLFLLELRNATTANRDELARDFERVIGVNVVIRVSGRSDNEKITNLPKSDCLSPTAAANWCISNTATLARGYPGVELAFVAHRFIDARASAWVRADPESPYVEVHGNWGLPDALQFCPYDIWDVHFPAEEITVLPAYKSNVLVNSSDGTWGYERVRNDVARFQSLGSAQVLDIAKRTLRIAKRLGRPCHVMWFVGCQTTDGREANIPWYRTAAHEIEQPQKRSTHTFPVRSEADLSQIADLRRKFPGLAVALEPQSRGLLRDNAFLKKVSEIVVPLNVPVVLGGSTLAHAFFQLRSHHCVVISAGDKEYLRPRKLVSYAKLVRDKIPERIAAQKEQQAVTIAPEEYRLGYLVGKVVEEAIEVREAKSREERLFELADVFEVLRALASLFEIDINGVIDAANKKRERSGGFQDGKLLWETSLPKPGQPSGTIESSADFDLLVEQTGPNTIRLPFTLVGFGALGVGRAVRLEADGVVLRVVLQKDAIEIEVQRQPTQLSLDV